MDLRTKPIREAITMYETDGNVRYVEYQPGNGTRYRMLIVSMKGLCDSVRRALGVGKSDDSWIISFPDTQYRSVVLSSGTFLAPWWLADKAGIRSESDGVVIAELIGTLLGLEHVSCEDYLKERANA